MQSRTENPPVPTPINIPYSIDRTNAYLRFPNLAVLASLGMMLLCLIYLTWRSQPENPQAAKTLRVFVAASLRPTLEIIRSEYQRSTGHHVEFQFGASGELLHQIHARQPTHFADVFLPADASYIRQAEAADLVQSQVRLARMKAVLLIQPNQASHIQQWSDLLQPGQRMALGHASSAIGAISREELKKLGLWEALAPHIRETATVTEAANAVKIGAAESAIVWNVLVGQYPESVARDLPELATIQANIEVAILKNCREPKLAAEWIAYLQGPGQSHFHAAGFQLLSETR